MANVNGFIAPSNVMGRGAQGAGDPGMGIVGRSRYLAFFREGLTLMASDTPFDERSYQTEIPLNGKVTLPKFMSGISNVWVYNGEGCDVNNATRLIFKDNYSHHGGSGSFANNNFANFSDATQDTLGWWMPLGINYAGIYKGVMYLPRWCGGGDPNSNMGRWQNIRIEYAGLGFDEFCQETEMCAPIWAEEALADYISMRALEHRLWIDGKEQVTRAQYKDKQNEYKSITGSWMNARVRWATMDKKDRQDITIKLSGLGGQFF